MKSFRFQNVEYICKEQKIRLKDFVSRIGIGPAALTHALAYNADTDTIQRMAASRV